MHPGERSWVGLKRPALLRRLGLFLTLFFLGIQPSLSSAEEQLAESTRIPGFDARVLFEEGRITFGHPETSAIEHRYTETIRYLVQTPAGRGVSRIEVVVDAFSELETLTGCCYTPSAAGKLASQRYCVHLGHAASVALSEAGGIHYSDTRLVMLDIPGVEVGDVVEYTYTLRSNGFSLPSWNFGGRFPTAKSVFTVTLPESWHLGYGYQEAGADRPLEPEVKSRSDSSEALFGAKAAGLNAASLVHARDYIWMQENLKALEAEPFGRPLSFMSRVLRVHVKSTGEKALKGMFPDWNAVALWYEGMTEGFYTLPTDGFSILVREDASPGLTGAAAFHRFTRDSIRYLAFYQGLGALRPHQASTVLEVRYGDCKDKSTLLIALLRQQGIKAWPALIGTRDHSRLDARVPTISAFNHLIVALEQGDGYLFVDPTATFVPFGRLPWAIAGQEALIVKPTGGVLVRTPLPDPRDNLLRRELELNPLTGELSITLETSGEYAATFRDLYRQDPQKGGRVLEAVAAAISVPLESPSLVSVNVPSVDEALPVVVRAKALVPSLALKDGILPTGQLFTLMAEVRIPAERRSPVVLGMPRVQEESIRIPLPDGLEVMSLPDPQETRSPVGTYSRKAKREGNVVTLSRVIVVENPEVEAELLPELRRLSELLISDGRSGLELHDSRRN